MAVDITGTTPQLEFIGGHEQYHRVPILYVVGFWANQASGLGDATGGTVTCNVKVLPLAAINPFLPNLDCWYTIQGLSFRTQTAMHQVLQGQSDYAESLNVNYSYSSIAENVPQEGGDGYFYHSIAGWENWIMRARQNRGYPRGIFASNFNAQEYYLGMNGLLLKTRQQLVSEGLW